MEKQLVSVIMPCYNMEHFVSDTITSVLRQTYSHWELLIVDDTSTDGTVAIIKELCSNDDRIRFIVKPQHTGIADTRNQCIHITTIGVYFPIVYAAQYMTIRPCITYYATSI